MCIVYIQIRDRGVSTCIAYLSTLGYLAYLYYLYGDDMAHELGNCYGKKTCAWRRENARKARRKLDWRPSERTDAGACAGVPPRAAE